MLLDMVSDVSSLACTTLRTDVHPSLLVCKREAQFAVILHSNYTQETCCTALAITYLNLAGN